MARPDAPCGEGRAAGPLERGETDARHRRGGEAGWARVMKGREMGDDDAKPKEPVATGRRPGRGFFSASALACARVTEDVGPLVRRSSPPRLFRGAGRRRRGGGLDPADGRCGGGLGRPRSTRSRLRAAPDEAVSAVFQKLASLANRGAVPQLEEESTRLVRRVADQGLATQRVADQTSTRGALRRPPRAAVGAASRRS